MHLTLVPVVGDSEIKYLAHAALGEGAARHRHPAGHPAVPAPRTSLPEEQRRKIALFTSVEERAVFSAVQVDDIYKIPMVLHEQGWTTSS